MHWTIDSDFALNATTRAQLTARTGYTAPAGHNRGAIIDVLTGRPGSEECLVQVGFSADTTTQDAGQIFDAILVAVKAAVRTRVVADGIVALRGRRFPFSL